MIRGFGLITLPPNEIFDVKNEAKGPDIVQLLPTQNLNRYAYHQL